MGLNFLSKKNGKFEKTFSFLFLSFLSSFLLLFSSLFSFFLFSLNSNRVQNMCSSAQQGLQRFAAANAAAKCRQNGVNNLVNH
jgi:hypothetical protein